jgi:hypothetical protein
MEQIGWILVSIIVLVIAILLVVGIIFMTKKEEEAPKPVTPIVAPGQIAPAPPTALQRKTTPIVVTLAIIAGLVCVCLSIVLWPTSDNSSPVTTNSHNVTYRITGSTRAVSITLQNATGGTEQKESGVPFVYTMPNMKRGAYYYISAQNKNDSGSVTCEVLIDDKVIKQSNSSGAYVIASCSGLVDWN